MTTYKRFSPTPKSSSRHNDRRSERQYVTYKLSYRDVCDLMAERGVTVVHTTVLRRGQRFYLNNLKEQDHRKVKQKCYPMLGFKTFGMRK